MTGPDYHHLLVLQQAHKDTGQPISGGPRPVGSGDVKKLPVEEMSRKRLDVSGCLSVMERSGKAK